MNTTTPKEMEEKGKILIIDDNEDVLFALNLLLEPYMEKIKVTTQPTRIKHFMETFQPDVILLDMNFCRDAISGQEGFDYLEEILSIDPKAIVIFMTAYSDTEKAVRAIKAGATDFISKPWEKEKLLATLFSAVKLGKSRKEVDRLQEQVTALRNDASLPELIGESPAMRKVKDTIFRLSDTDANILILGENGTGKDLVARMLKHFSPRATEAFVTIDLGSIPEQLFESELFGYEKGAFTDAHKSKPGRMEMASGGTLFLDEIGDIPLSLQGKLLRVLENRTIERVGSNKPIALDIRLISATNKDLEEEITRGLFREDLLYRINTMTVTVPPLRRRKEDLPDMIEFFIRKIEKEQKKKILDIEPLTLDFLYQYDYPGNIRELKNLLERMVALSDDGILRSRGFAKSPSVPAQEQREVLPLRTARGIFEKEHIENALAVTGGNVAAAAKLLDITKRQLWNKIAEYKIQR